MDTDAETHDTATGIEEEPQENGNHKSDDSEVVEEVEEAEEKIPDYDDGAKINPQLQMAQRHSRRMFLVKTPRPELGSGVKHLDEQMEALKPKLKVASDKFNAKKVSLQP